jgi:hypothetical protein
LAIFGTGMRVTLSIWIDGVKLFERHDLPTPTYSRTPYVIWGIGNYEGYNEPEGQRTYIKDVFVTKEYLG